MHRPEHDTKPLSNIFNAIPWQTSFLFMRQFWQTAADGAMSTSRVQLPDAPPAQLWADLWQRDTGLIQQRPQAAHYL